jgi:C4-dicarboxylate-binding protein DctP
MKKHRIFSILTIISFFIAGLFFASSVSAAQAVKKTYRLSFATQMPLGHLISRSGDLFVKRAGELSGGKIKIKHHCGGTLFTDKEIPEAVMSGGCSMGIATSSRWAGHVAANHFWEIPFLFSNKEQVEKVADALIPIIDKALYPKGAKLLGFVYYGDADMIGNSKKPAYKPSDLKRLKLRSFSVILSTAVEAAGGTPVVMSSAEVYTAIQRGTIDGGISGTTTFVVRKWMEVVKHVTLVRGMVCYPALPFTMAINKNVWENMEPAAQKIMMQAAKETWRYSSDEVLKETDKAMKTLEARANLKVYKIAFGSKEWKEWRDVMFEPAKAKFLAIGGDMGPKILEIVKQYE